jgi:hypothetical protein
MQNLPFFLVAHFADGAKVRLDGSHATQAQADRAAGSYIAHHRPLMPSLKCTSVAVHDGRISEAY